MTAKELGKRNAYPFGNSMCYSGLTVRQEIAKSIMSSLTVNTGRNGFAFHNPKDIAKKSVELADALLEELAKDMEDLPATI